MGKKTTLEEAYFHISNGGISFKIVEEASEREAPVYDEKSKGTFPLRELGKETRHNRRWYFEVRTSSFGAGTTFRFPLGHPLMVAWTIEALQRVLARMLTDTGQPTDGFEFAFRELRAARVSHQGGEKVDFEWPEPVPRGSGHSG